MYTLKFHFRYYRNFTGPVMFSTMEDGRIVRGIAGVPDEGPVLLVGYHMLMGLELVPLIEEFLRAKKILVRGIAHPTLFSQLVEKDGANEDSFMDLIRLFGGLPVSPSNLFKLLETKSHVLLYPGGAREALHRKVNFLPLFLDMHDSSSTLHYGKPITVIYISSLLKISFLNIVLNNCF